MPTVRTVLTGPAAAERANRPRDDAMVLETCVEPGRFTAVEGPYARWERSVAEEGGHLVETVRFHTAVPHWSWLVDALLRRPARTGVRPGHTPVWAPTDRLSPHDSTILGLCATLAAAAGFLGGLIGQTIAFIAEDFAGPHASTTSTQSTSLAVIRTGAVLTFAAMALADRRGRRPMMRICLLLASAATLLCAVAPNLATVVGAQVVSRGLVAAAAFLIPIVCAEELPARSRAYAIGLMILPGGLGAGFVIWCLPILNLGAGTWRLIYLLAVPAAVVTVHTTRRLPETRRFVHDDESVYEHRHQHIRVSRLVLLAVGMFLLNVFVAPTQQLQTDYLHNTRHMNAAAIAVFLLLTNTWGFVGVAVGARIADRRSRRLAAFVGLLGLAVGNTLMFQFGGAAMWGASLLGSVVGGATAPSMGALLPELFPTLRRGAANGLLNGAGVAGSICGLLVVGAFVSGGDYGPTIAALATGPLAVAALVWMLPESAGVELETLNRDD
jgi:MFS family permease